MLDVKKRYFVVVEENQWKAAARWASMHTMKIKEKPVSLPASGRAYELDVQYNDDLKLSLKVGRVPGAINLLDGETAIGKVSYDLMGMETCVAIHPILAD